MLTQLTLDQVSSYWDIVKYAIEESLPPLTVDHPDRMNKILSNLLSNESQCWVSYIKGEEETKFEGVVVTKIIYDDVSDTKNLLIYCLYGYDAIDSKSWMIGLEALVKYAKANNCAQVVGYTDVPRVIEIVNSLGGQTDYTFISFNVNETVEKLNGLGEV